MNSMAKLYYGFLDESGIIEEYARKGNYFVVSIIVVGNPGELKHILKHARKKVRTAKGKFYASRKFKASKEARALIRQVLLEIAKCNIEIVVGLWDKRQPHHESGDKNILYAQYVARTVALALEKWPRLALTVHKRYTSPAIQIQMNQIIQDHIHEYIQRGIFLSIDHRTEAECRELELADAIVWAVFQKYNNGDAVWYDIIKEKIQKENRLAA